MGPSIGSIVFGLSDFQITMYFFAGLNLVALIICYLFIPNELNQTVSIEEIAELEMMEEELCTLDEKEDLDD